MGKTSAWRSVLILFGVAVAGSSLSWLAAAGPWRAALADLYYLPIVIAAIHLGLKEAVAVGLAAGALHAAAASLGGGDPWIGSVTEGLFFVGVGTTVAKLSTVHESLTGRQALPGGSGGDSLQAAFHSGGSGRDLPGFGQIVASLVRRFRAPVSNIEGAVGLLDDARFPDEKRDEFVRIIRKESHQLERSLSDIQIFTQPDRPRWAIVDVSRLLDEVIQLAGPREHEHFFLFRQDVPSDLPPLHCDAGQIRTLLLNLVMNAILATPGGGQIRFAVRQCQGGIAIAVQDHGRGILQQNLGRVFDPFFTTRESGLGLGLTVARQIAAAHGGTISVDWTSEEGTSISLYLPLRPSNSYEHRPHISR